MKSNGIGNKNYLFNKTACARKNWALFCEIYNLHKKHRSNRRCNGMVSILNQQKN